MVLFKLLLLLIVYCVCDDADKVRERGMQGLAHIPLLPLDWGW